VKFCDDVPAERTGESAAAQEFLARLQNNQGPAESPPDAPRQPL
jgi:hypothetical protein